MNTKQLNITRSARWFSAGIKLTLALAASALLADSAGAQTIFANTNDACPVYIDADNAVPPANPFQTVRITDTSVSVGRQGTSALFHQAAVFPFLLPTLPPGEVFDTATFQFDMTGETISGAQNADLYGLAARSASDVLPGPTAGTSIGDFWMGGGQLGLATDDTNSPALVAKLQDNILINGIATGLKVTDAVGSSNLVAYLNAQYDNGAGAGKYVFLRLSLDATPGGQRYTVVMAEGGAGGASHPQISYTTVSLAPVLTWVGDGGGNTWTVGGAAIWTNAILGGPLTIFTNNDQVVFNDSSANTTVNISGTVQPGVITVNSDINNYTFNGGTLGGAGKLKKQGTGTLTLSLVNPAYTGGTELESGTLAINSAASIALAGLSGGGALTKSGAGTLTVSGANSFSGTATVTAGGLVISNNASGNAAYTISAGTLSVLEATPGTLSVGTLQLANGVTLTLNDGAVSSLVPLINAAAFTNSGTLTVNYSATTIAPGATPLIKYNPANAVLGTYTVSLPGGYTGSIVTNVANSTIDLVITGTPAKTWVGGDMVNGVDQWSVGTYLNWSGGTVFADGEYVSFLDGTAYPNVVVQSTVAPSLMVVSNSATAYSFSGFAGITTPLLVKQGPGTASLANSGNAIASISLQQGTLSYDATITEAASITGAGSLAVGSSANLTLSGNNSGFTGPITVASGSTLTLGANNVLGATNGTTTVANGATLEINGKTVPTEQVVVSGLGTSSDGAIKNSAGTGTGILAAFRQVRLAGDTSFGGTARWDIRAPDNSGTNNAVLDTTGSSYNLTKSGANIVALVSVNISPSINNISVDSGLLSFENYTPSLGNPAGTLTLAFGAQVTFFNSLTDFTPSFTKNFVANGGVWRQAGGGNVNFLGPVTLNSDLELQGNAGTLTINGAVGGFSGVNKTQGGTVALLGANNYSGNTTVTAGTLKLSTASSGGTFYQVNNGSTLGVQRTSGGGKLNINSSLNLGETPGSGAVTLLFDLSTFGGGATALLDVSGGTLTTNAATYNVAVQADLNFLGTGTVSLFKYAPGAFTSVVVGTLPAGVTGTITNNVAANQVEMIVTAVSRAIDWVGNVNNNWNINTTANWLDTTNATTYKEVGVVGDSVTFGNGASNYTVNLAATVTPGGSYVQVTASNVYTFSGAGSIAGPAGVRVTDTGAGLVLGGNNTYTGGTFFDNGFIAVGSESNLGGPTGELRWAGGTLQANGSLTNTRPLVFQNTTARNQLTVATNQTVQLGGTIDSTSNANEEFWKAGPGTLVLTNEGNLRVMVEEGTAILASNAKITNGTSFQNVSSTNGVAKLIVKDSAFLENTSTAALNIADGNTQSNSVIAGELYIQDNAVLSLRDLYVGKYLNATGRVYQTGGLVTNNNAGAGNWRLGGITDGVDTNTFGGYYLSGGSLLLTRDVQVGRLGGGELIVSGAGTMQAVNLNAGTENTGNGSVLVNGGSVTLSGNMNVPLRGKSGSLVVSNGGAVTASALVLGVTNDANSGTVTIGSGGTLTVGQVTGSASARNITFNGGTLKANASSATFMEGLTSATIGSGGVTVNTDTNNITINQALSGVGGLTKTGAGTLTLPVGPVGYTGPTVVNGGTLSGGLVGSPVQFAGNLTIAAGGTVAPGSSPGEIASVGAISLAGTARMEIKKGLFSNTSDKILAVGTLSASGGTVEVVFDPTADTALAPGDTFTLFNKALTGSHTLITPSVDIVNSNLVTWTDNLAVNGTIAVATVTTPVTTPAATNITYTVSGGQLILNWPNGQGWLLQGQTNPLSVGLRTNWVYLGTNSPYTNVFVAPSVFYRLIYTNAP